MTCYPFQHYVLQRLIEDFPEWAKLREDIKDPENGSAITVRFVTASPANPDNVLCLLIERNLLTAMFGHSSLHEHFDPEPCWTAETSPIEQQWDSAYSDLLNEYVLPVIENRLFLIWHSESASLSTDPEQFLKLNGIAEYRIESWGLSDSRKMGQIG